MAAVAGQRVSDDPLPGDIPPDDLEAITPEQAKVIEFTSEIVDLLSDTLEMIDTKPISQNFNGALVVLVKETPEGNSFMFNTTESVSLTYLLGILELVKSSLVQTLMTEQMVPVDEDETPAS